MTCDDVTQLIRLQRNRKGLTWDQTPSVRRPLERTVHGTKDGSSTASDRRPAAERVCAFPSPLDRVADRLINFNEGGQTVDGCRQAFAGRRPCVFVA